MSLGLGRIPVEDKRDQNFPMLAMLPRMVPISELSFKYWRSSDVWLDQGSTSTCVGHGWAHFIEDGPIMHPEKGTLVDPFMIYAGAQQVDEWPGEDYDGTSVRAGAKFLQSMGYIGEYTWAFDLQTMINAILTTSPVVIGVNWYTDMFTPDSKGLIKIGGRNEGGHCLKADGVNRKLRMFRLKNSWGDKWSPKKYAWISFDDMERLISENAEICMAVEVKKLPTKNS